jgi:hypothetical protein
LQAPGHAEPGTIRPVTGTANAPVVAASWHPAIRQHYRGEFGAATPSAPLPASNSGQIVAGIRPVIAASWRRDYAAQSGHQRVSAPRSQRVGAPLPGSAIEASAPSAELATKSDTIRPVTDSETADVAGSIRPVIGRRIRGNWRPVSAPWSPRHIRDRLQGTIRPVVSQRIRGESENIRPVNAMRWRPLSDSEIGVASGKPTSVPWSRGFSGKYPPRNRMANSGSQGRAPSAPLSPLQKRPSVRIR